MSGGAERLGLWLVIIISIVMCATLEPCEKPRFLRMDLPGVTALGNTKAAAMSAAKEGE